MIGLEQTISALGVAIHVGAEHHTRDLRRVGAIGHSVQDTEIGLEVRPILVVEVVGHGRLAKLCHAGNLTCLRDQSLNRTP